LKTLIAEIKVEDRGHIRPFFYVPTLTSNNKPQVDVRDLGPQVEVGGLEPPSRAFSRRIADLTRPVESTR
jgi:hypothetical protein